MKKKGSKNIIKKDRFNKIKKINGIIKRIKDKGLFCETYEGNYRAVSRNFGFVILTKDVKTGNNVTRFEEVYISSKDSLSAMTDDLVLVEIKNSKPGSKNREGVIKKILRRDSDEVIGIFEPNDGYGFVVPINKRITFDLHIDKKYFSTAVKDSIVKAKILSEKGNGNNPEGAIIDVIGHKDDPTAEITAIVKDFKIKDTFDIETINEADKVAVPIKESDLKNRKDIRDKLFITIDGEDTKDIDDAICLEKLDNGNLILYVSIADVSHYVKEGSALDREALIRGNSVYLLDRVIPMIPHVLSNGMCSLNQDVDRLSMTCEMEFDKNYNIVRYDIYKSIMQSKKRMTYNEVQSILDNKLSNFSNQNIVDMLFDMIILSRNIRKKRYDRGAINFDLKETYIEVNNNLEPVAVREKERLEANDLIEDFMVSANETVAYEFTRRKVPFLYRTHEPCDEEKIQNLMITLNSLAIPFSHKKEIEPKDIQNLLSYVKGKPYEEVIEKLSLRSMNQAKYTKNLIGHFALASKYYSHFTSPIRRYSDLQIHRIMKEVLYGNFDEKRKAHYDDILDSVAFNISKTERLAIECERDIDDLKKCEYMKRYIGEEFEGNVSGLTNFGIYVELPNTIEGMIPFRSLTDDHYIFDETKFIVVGERTKKTFTFGQKLKVIVAKCSEELRTIDFEIAE